MTSTISESVLPIGMCEVCVAVHCRCAICEVWRTQSLKGCGPVLLKHLGSWQLGDNCGNSESYDVWAVQDVE
jgi:hypothetical protein